MDVNSSPSTDMNADQGPRILGASVTVFALATFSTALRVLSRRVSKAGLWWDDWLIMAALAFCSMSLFVTVIFGQDQLGMHLAALDDDAEEDFYQNLYIYNILYPFPIALMKYSVLTLYSRKFKAKSRVTIGKITGLVVTIWLLVTIICAALQCIPTQAFWDESVPGTCLDLNKFNLGIAIPNIITNFAIIIIPMRWVWTLQMDKPQKMAASFCFAVGGFLCIVSVIRLFVVWNLKQEDETWNYVNSAIWTNVESSIGILSACLPTLGPVLSFLSTGSFHSRTSTTGPPFGNGTAGGFFELESREHREAPAQSTTRLTGSETLASLPDLPIFGVNQDILVRELRHTVVV